MRYQERIYVQNDSSSVRNKDILNVNMSSDICIFKSPQFSLSGGTKITCGDLKCDLSGFSATTILSAATFECFTQQAVDISCYSGTSWTTKIYGDGFLLNANTYFRTNLISGATPSNQNFYDSILLGLNALGYTTEISGSNITIQKVYGGPIELSFDSCVSFDLKPQVFSCPITYSATPANDKCVNITVTGATFNASGQTIVSGSTGDGSYLQTGAYFYPKIQNNSNLPLFYNNVDPYIVDQTNTMVTPLNINTTSPFLMNPGGGFVNGRLINAGISGTSMNLEYVGFTKCIDIEFSGTYYVALASDNFCRFKLDGQLMVFLSATTGQNFRIWSVFPFDLTSGKHIIEMEANNQNGTIGSAAFEIYNPATYQALTGATSSANTNTIFTTEDFRGGYFEIGTTVGYTCPNGYSLDNCSTPISCVKILSTGITQTSCSGTCDDYCETICLNDFPHLSSGDVGIYNLNATTTSIPFTFNFTGNTSTFTVNKANFKYEIYKYDRNVGGFKVPSVYQSGLINYSTFSGTNQITQSIPVNALGLDGDYIIKGYFEGDICSTYLSKLNKKIDTSVYKNGDEYRLYNSDTDHYFIAVRNAETPYFNATLQTGFTVTTPTLYEQVILVDDVDVNTNDTIQSELYERTGSTFVLVSEYTGDVLVTLNGLVLSNGLDYTIDADIITFIGVIRNGDVITLYYTRIQSPTLIGDNILITNSIPNVTTGNQGSNRYVYNTTTSKYEIYCNNIPVTGTNIIVTINGAKLTSGIDFYQSISNPKRIILVGTIEVNDIILIVYYPVASVINGINNNSNLIGWYVNNAPQDNNGVFLIEYSTTPTFSTFTNVGNVVKYIKNVGVYSGILTLTGNIGTNYYYRVKNIKNYQNVCGDYISSTGYSEVVKVTIQNNSINSY